MILTGCYVSRILLFIGAIFAVVVPLLFLGKLKDKNILHLNILYFYKTKEILRSYASWNLK